MRVCGYLQGSFEDLLRFFKEFFTVFRLLYGRVRAGQGCTVKCIWGGGLCEDIDDYMLQW